MTVITYLKTLLTDVIDNYQKYFRKTFEAALIYTLIFLAASLLLFKFSNLDPSVIAKKGNLINYLFIRYSKNNTYSIIDLSKTVFIFLIAIFSVGLTRSKDSGPETKKISFLILLRKITLKDVAYLLAILIITSLLDYCFFRLDAYSQFKISDIFVGSYIHSWIFNFRIYVPLMLFALALYYLIGLTKEKLTIKKILLLYISVWLLNQFCYESFIWVNTYILNLVTLPFPKTGYVYLFKSIIGIPLLIFYFLGYYSALTSFSLINKAPVTI